MVICFTRSMKINCFVLLLTLGGICYQAPFTEGANRPTPPPVTTGEEMIHLTEQRNSVTIQHPTHGGSYDENEHLHWIIRNEDPHASGFRIDAKKVFIEHYDKILIPQDGCHFEIRKTTETPIFRTGPELNITFISDDGTAYGDFTLEVSAVNVTKETPCFGIEKELVLRENDTSLEIMHPEDGGQYKNNESYVWKIKNEHSGAAGFQVTFKEMDIGDYYHRENLRVEGNYCSYGWGRFINTSKLVIRGDQMNITWESDFFHTGTGFNISIASLQEVNKTDCLEYTCDDSGRCVRVEYYRRLSWAKSQLACEAEGARLVVITDEGMDNLVRSVLTPLYSLPYSPWIGIYGDSREDMIWTTGNSTKDYNYENWQNLYAPDFILTACGNSRGKSWGSALCYLDAPYVCEKV